jgi:mono/diheme cytochrome c family protein
VVVKKKPAQHIPAIIAALLVLMSCALASAAAQKSSQPIQKFGAALNNPTAVASGKQIYGTRCEICHFSASKAKKVGPGLANIYPGGKFANGKKVDDAAMRVWIEAGGKDMPGFREALKPNEVRDLIAYLRTL